MVKAKIERTYVDVEPSDFSEAIQNLILAQRRTYEADKAARKAIVDAMNAEQVVGNDQVVSGVHHTRWGQMQLSIADKAQPKAQSSSKRKTLADYLNERENAGMAS